MRMRIPLLLALLLAPSLAAAQPPDCRILEVTGAPLKLADYTCAYRQGGRYSRDGIEHELSYTNVSNKGIRAVEIGIVSFDVFNDFIGKVGGISMELIEPNETKKKASWVQSRYGDFAFQTGIAYVSRVRFQDGEVWSANEQEILSAVRKIEKDFDAANLKKEKPPAGSQQ